MRTLPFSTFAAGDHGISRVKVLGAAGHTGLVAEGRAELGLQIDKPWTLKMAGQKRAEVQSPEHQPPCLSVGWEPRSPQRRCREPGSHLQVCRD